MRHFAIAGVCLVALAACGKTPPAERQALLAAGVSAGTTLATIAAQNNTTAAALVSRGVAFCGDAVSPLGVLAAGGIEAAANAAGVPVAVTGMTAAAVTQTCAGLGKVAGALPAAVDPATVPVFVANTPLPAITALPGK